VLLSSLPIRLLNRCKSFFKCEKTPLTAVKGFDKEVIKTRRRSDRLLQAGRRGFTVALTENTV
jgi:hypothetical protein